MKSQFLALAMPSLLAASAHAATITNFASEDTTASQSGSFTTATAFNPLGGDKLIVTVALERAGGSGDVVADSVTFGGQTLDLVVVNASTRYSAIFTADLSVGLRNVASTLTFNFTAGPAENSNGYAIGFIAADGLVTGVPTGTNIGTSSNSGTVTVTPTSPDGLFVGALTAQGGQGEDVTTPGATALYNDVDSGSSNGSAGFVDLTGVVGSTDFTYAGSPSTSVSTAAFFANVVPEPSVTLLGSLGLLGLLRRRR